MMTRLLSRQAPWKLIGPMLFMLILGGCAGDQQQAGIQTSQTAEQEANCDNAPDEAGQSSRNRPEEEEREDTDSPVDSIVTSPAAHGRSSKECYHLQPSVSSKTKQKNRRCEPQSLPFARCRSGVNSCNLGWNNGPLTWFACEKKRGNTSSVPRAGSVLILAAVKRHKMPTGHVAYVEKVVAEDDSHYQIIFSHTNYDRKCALETDIKGSYNSSTKLLDIHSGAWKDWGKGLPVAGFILR